MLVDFWAVWMAETTVVDWTVLLAETTVVD